MTLLGLLNFLVLQWFGVRLCGSFEQLTFELVTPPDDDVLDIDVSSSGRWSSGRWYSRFAPPRGVHVSWSLLRWVWPLTGWWSDYRWIARRP